MLLHSIVAVWFINPTGYWAGIQVLFDYCSRLWVAIPEALKIPQSTPSPAKTTHFFGDINIPSYFRRKQQVSLCMLMVWGTLSGRSSTGPSSSPSWVMQSCTGDGKDWTSSVSCHVPVEHSSCQAGFQLHPGKTAWHLLHFYSFETLPWFAWQSMIKGFFGL